MAITPAGTSIARAASPSSRTARYLVSQTDWDEQRSNAEPPASFTRRRGAAGGARQPGADRAGARDQRHTGGGAHSRPHPRPPGLRAIASRRGAGVSSSATPCSRASTWRRPDWPNAWGCRQRDGAADAARAAGAAGGAVGAGGREPPAGARPGPRRAYRGRVHLAPARRPTARPRPRSRPGCGGGRGCHAAGTCATLDPAPLAPRAGPVSEHVRHSRNKPRTVPMRRRRSVALAVAATLTALAALVVACGGDDDDDPWSAQAIAPDPETIVMPVLVNSQLGVGPNRIAFGLFDRGGRAGIGCGRGAAPLHARCRRGRGGDRRTGERARADAGHAVARVRSRARGRLPAHARRPEHHRLLDAGRARPRRVVGCGTLRGARRAARRGTATALLG